MEAPAQEKRFSMDNEIADSPASPQKESNDDLQMECSASLFSERSSRKNNASKDDFWDALSSHYDYLMDDALINTCREASSDLSLDDAEEVKEVHCWSFTQFIEHFKRLHDTLHHLQVSMQDASQEMIIEEQKRVAYLCKHFNEQAHKLSKRYPDMRDEVHRHLNLLNNKWEAVEQSINPNRMQPAKDSAIDEIISRMRCLRKFLRDLENRLSPIGLSTKLSLETLEEKRMEQQVLQKEIEAKGKYVSGLLKLCECLDDDAAFGQNSPLRWDPERIRRVAENLQRHWHSIWLQSLECQYVVQTLINQVASDSPDVKSDGNYSEEPLKKYPRLSDDSDCGNLIFRKEPIPIDMNVRSDDELFVTDLVVRKTNKWLQNNKKSPPAPSGVKEGKSPTNDKGVMVGSTSIAELKAGCNGNLGKFEIVQDVGYSSETSAHLSNDEQGELTNIVLCECDADTHAKSANDPSDHPTDQCSSSLPVTNVNPPTKLFLAPDKYPSFHLKRHLYFGEEKPITDSKFTKSVPNTFYRMTSLDAELCCEDLIEQVISDSSSTEPGADKVDLSPQKTGGSSTTVNEEGSTSQCVHTSEVPDAIPISQCSVPNSPNSTLKRSRKVQKSAGSPSGTEVVTQSEKSKRTARVREWLDNCTPNESEDAKQICSTSEKNMPDKEVVDSSCDASGEYTTTESDGEKSAATDDVNNSLSFSQSFAGSVETVVQVTNEEAVANRSGSCELSPAIRLRKKKKHSRDRPWSVIEGNQIPLQRSRFSHSTSEGALNSIGYLQEEKNANRSKKRRFGKERLSLTDMSVCSCPLTCIKKSTKISAKYNRHSDGSDGCGISKEKCEFLEKKLQHRDSLKGEKKDESAATQSSDRQSVSSFNSSSSKRQRRSRRKAKSSHSDSSAKQKGLVEGSPTEKKSSLGQGTIAVVESAPKGNNNTSCTEDQSSVSDQVWDEYQDPPYLSEPYSEQTVDEDQVRRLIDFGDDYRAILGSHSDASSAKSVCKAATKSRFRCVPFSLKDSIHHADLPNSGSDSDSEDFQNMLATSLKALHFVRNCLKENTTKESFALSSEFAELVATCQTNMCHLYAIHEELVSKSNSQTFSAVDLQKLEELIKEWEGVQEKVLCFPNCKKDTGLSSEHLQAAVLEVQSIMKSQKAELNAIWICASDALSAVSSSEDLESNIKALQNGLATLQEMKGAVLSVSAKVLGLSGESCGQDVFPLRDAAAKLYQQWEDVYELSSSQLTKLQSLQSRWVEGSERDLETYLETALQFQNPGKTEIAQKFKKNDLVKVPHELKAAHDLVDMVKCAKCKTNFNKLDLNVDDFLPLNGMKLKEMCDKANNTEKLDAETAQEVKTKSRLWRVLWASMPIQFVIVLSYCLACLMGKEQNCEDMNNLDFSVFPHLRHYQGPPV